MRIGVIPENLLERIVLAAGIVPTPAVESSVVWDRALMSAVRLDVFEAVRSAPMTAADIAARC